MKRNIDGLSGFIPNELTKLQSFSDSREDKAEELKTLYDSISIESGEFLCIAYTLDLLGVLVSFLDGPAISSLICVSRGLLICMRNFFLEFQGLEYGIIVETDKMNLTSSKHCLTLKFLRGIVFHEPNLLYVTHLLHFHSKIPKPLPPLSLSAPNKNFIDSSRKEEILTFEYDLTVLSFNNLELCRFLPNAQHRDSFPYLCDLTNCKTTKLYLLSELNGVATMALKTAFLLEKSTKILLNMKFHVLILGKKETFDVKVSM
jgi:hypothetical protein